MGKKKNKNKIDFRVTPGFLKAYDITLEKAANSLYEKSDFRCQVSYPIEYSLSCVDCPFQRFSDYCTDPFIEDGAGFARTFDQWQEWFYKLTGIKDNRSKEMLNMFMGKPEQTKEPKEPEKETQADEAQTKELEAKTKAKYEIKYLTLDFDKPQTKYVRKVVDLLYHIQQWYQEAIKWNLIANGNISKIPHDFKDIYIKVYDPEEGVALFQDEYTLKSKGLKLAWTRDDQP